MPNDRDLSAAAPAEGAAQGPEVLARSPVEQAGDRPFVVGIGASAGGLEAMEHFFRALPPDSGMAFVIVQHLAPTHESLLADILTRYTAMPVCQVTDGMRVAANHVYIIPPNRMLALSSAGFVLVEPPADSRVRLPIDYFFRSLAQDCKERAVAIVLSGTGEDGRDGLEAIKEHGGLVLVQEPSSAQHRNMPESAIDTGLADFVLPPEEMAKQLLAHARHPGLRAMEASLPDRREDTASLPQILALLREQSGQDFSRYKSKTLTSRIERRIALRQMACTADYVQYLRTNPEEQRALFRELLIGVTRFFRDPEAFAALEAEVLPRLFQDRSPDDPVRVWVPGCSSGEEAYSLAILLREQRARSASGVKVQVFATDLDPQAIKRARAGRYPAGIAADVGPERLARFFVQDGEGYVVREQVRAELLFAVQSVTQDPPFSRVDLISCRNLLIYLEPALQGRVLATFHYALKPGGFLFLGDSESPDEASSLFDVLDQKSRIFQRLGKASGPSPPRPSSAPWRGDPPAQGRRGEAFSDQALRAAVEARAALGAKGARAADQRQAEHERELQTLRDYVQATVEKLEAANEALQSANEELQSANEELQSANEELETVNAERAAEIEQLTRLQNDLENAFVQLDIGILFLDRRLCIRRFNPAATRISNLLPGDIGRPLADMVIKIKYAHIVEDARRVFDELATREVEVEAHDGRWYSMRLRPYRTMENLIDGVTLTFYDITARRRAEAVLLAAQVAAGVRAETSATPGGVAGGTST